jgi:hypothetical protein
MPKHSHANTSSAQRLHGSPQTSMHARMHQQALHRPAAQAYGVSKFVSGVLGSQFSARLLLGCGLMATAAVNLAFGASSTLTWFCVLWGLNGMLQVRRARRGQLPQPAAQSAAADVATWLLWVGDGSGRCWSSTPAKGCQVLCRG